MAPTLDSIAKRCRVSKVTVSLALRGSPRISASMRARVAAVAHELGYIPNPMVSALMTSLRASKKTKFVCNLAFLTSFPTRDGWKENPSFARYLTGATARATALGYGMETFWTQDLSLPDLARTLQNRGIRGLLLAPLPTFGLPLSLAWDFFAAVAFGHTFTAAPIHRVTNSQFHTISLALDQCLKRGHRRIGLAMPAFVDAKVESRWLAGYLAWQHLHPTLEKIDPLLVDQFDEASVVAWMKKEKPDAVLANHGPILTWLRQNGFRVPDDVSFVHLNWTPEKGELSGTNQQPEEIGAAAVDLLAEQINQNRRGIPEKPKTITLESLWHEGTTCPARG